MIGRNLALASAIGLAAAFCTTSTQGRTWKNEAGKSIEAEMVELKGDSVVLKRSDGRVFTVPLAKLSKEDQNYARQQAAKDKSEDAAEDAEKPKKETDAKDAKKDKKEGKEESPGNKGSTKEKMKAAKRGDFHLDRGVTTRTYLESAAVYKMPEEAAILQKIRSMNAAFVALEHGNRKGYEVHVPDSYDPDMPFGVISYVSAGDKGNAPKEYKELLKKSRLIWIGGNGIGNDGYVPFRQAKAVEAVHLLAEEYTLDPERIYIAGTSGGGRLASQAMVSNPQIFAGGCPIIGCNHYSEQLKGLSPQTLALAKRQGRYVFITGDTDFNRDQTKTLVERYKKEGFANIAYMQVPGMGHRNPSPEWFEKALNMVDAPLKETAKMQYDAAVKAERSKRLGEAAAGFARAAAHGEGQSFAGDAKGRFGKLRAAYLDEVDKTEQAIADRNFSKAAKSLTELKKKWMPYAGLKIAQLAESLKEAKRAKPK